ncbi:Alkyl hydroperoxide reductase subunit F [bacterium HR12]|nr:Alkyl hydroperoxide reductase subunit F [bacterium HR12]
MELTEKDRAALARALEGLSERVRLLLITDRSGSRSDCWLCPETEELIGAIAAASDEVELEIVDVREDPGALARYGAIGVPTLVMLRADGADPGIRFSGIPAGFELASLIQAIALLGSGDPGLEARSREALARLDRDVTIRVFVTPTCPYCPRAALTAMRMAMGSERVRAEIVEAQEFPELADAYRVFGVPKIVINDRVEVEGAMPESSFLDAVLHAVAEDDPATAVRS